ncbi:MAG: DUF1501 domain-containing protein [Planctomycetaceae bacterium]|nr:DUF1501 domain-containing protein [Planctomycetaceae bacterium]
MTGRGTRVTSETSRLSRRSALGIAGAGAIGWLTPVAELLARQAEAQPRQPARSVIVLWLAGGPSQLETFDPHPQSAHAGGTQAIATSAPGMQLAAGLEQVAAEAHSLALVRSLVSPEADHERGTYVGRTGYAPDPTAVHPSLGAICCHELSAESVEIPRHISIMSGQWPSRGGYLGAEFDAFKTLDPRLPIPDLRAPVSDQRLQRRMRDLDVVDRTFLRGREAQLAGSPDRELTQRARAMMSSEQLRAFQVDDEPRSVQQRYGDTPFGRGCLAARRLIEVGVRCVEITLGGWDSHVDNHAIHQQLVGVLDPALAALLAELREREQLEHTLVLCGGEFGRTPQLNPLGGRDHWPHGFSALVAGGPIRGGAVVGETDPAGSRKVVEPHSYADLHATLLTALGIDPRKELLTPIGRPLKLSEGTPIAKLLG